MDGREMGRERLDGLIADVSEISGYFHLYTADAPGGPWLPLDRLLDDGPGFAGRVATVAERIGTDESRVAASVLHLGLAARLWSPVLGAAVAHRVILDWDADVLRWKDVLGGPLPLSLPAPSGSPVAEPVAAAAALYAAVEPLLERLSGLVLGEVKLAPRLLWGNNASALGGAVRALASARPSLAADALALGDALMVTGKLRGTGDFAEPAPGRVFFTRTTCCLYYRIPGGGKCGDCALLDPATRRAQWARALKETP
ncbi:(2Fe-2S)-binding protein [Actinocorallia sp. A-T 12471]|uniref:(2Fe-2S)-binding protein n=1 Tax=Actinocorallia sp. A-T 12471 TaxID=3089813 RepID=UPI0029D20B94|nr:(2Fe-2S)-binding protein [Actinocorallia sp. A-T 12471]MDX6742244.1 (2Fe-2S)-binding protein [Actinocorallia sp. A-T 12471]